MKRLIRITETLEKRFWVDATTEEEALKLAENAYNEGKIVLDYDDFVDKDIEDETDVFTDDHQGDDFQEVSSLFPSLEDVLSD